LASFEATTLSDFFAEAVPHLRVLAPQTLVFVEPTGFSGAMVKTTLKKPPGDGIVFAPHFYPVTGGIGGVIDGLTKWADIAAQWNTPVFVGEFGTRHDRGDAPEFLRAHFDAFDALGMGGTEWEYSVAPETWNGETFSLAAPDGTEYAVAHEIVRPYARAIAGSAITGGFDTNTRAFTLTYAPAAGVSEIALPARAYPAGYDVALSGGCVDRSQPNRLLVKADDGASKIDLKVTTRTQ
jgi:endoglycosylceramidase